jgi:hypothetical protein
VLGWRVQEEEGIEGISWTCSPWRGGNGRVAVGGMQRRPAVVSRGGGALVHFRPWEGAEQGYLGERMLATTSICSGRAPSRRIEDGRRRSCSPPGGARLQGVAHIKERCGARLGLRGKATGVLRGATGRGRAGYDRDGRRRADAGLRRSPVGARLLPGWAWRAWERVRRVCGWAKLG